MSKDEEEKGSEPDLNLKSYLCDAYLHPIFHSFEEPELVEVRVDNKHQTHHIISPPGSEPSSNSPPHQETEMQNVHHYNVQPPGNAYHRYEVEPSGNAYHYEDAPPTAYHYEDATPTAFHYEAESPRSAYHYDFEQHSNMFGYDLGSPHHGYRY